MARFKRSTATTRDWTVVFPSGTRLDIVRVEHQRNVKPRVISCESYPLDGGLAATLARLRQGGKLDGRTATLLGASEYHFLSIEAPPLPESVPQSELREAVRWQIKDMVDTPVVTASVDALRIPAQPGRPAQLLAAVASHSVLRPLIESFQSAKVELAEITVPEIAQRNFAHLFETPDRALALLSFSADSGLLTLTCNGELYATRRLDVGATDLARDKSLYERVVLDVQRSLDNFDRNFSHLSLQRLLVVPIPVADDFIAHLRDNLYQPVETLAISDGLDIDAAPMLANAATLADALPALGVALGLAQGESKSGINLFDPALQQQRDFWTARNFGWGLAASFLLCATWGGWAHWNQARVSQELAAVQPQVEAARAEALQLGKQIAGYQPDARLQATLNDGRVRLESRTQVLALLRKGMSPDSGSPAELLRGFARQVPAGLWLTSFSVQADDGPLEIHGRTNDPRLIPAYVRRLNAEQSFRGRTFAALEISMPDSKTENGAAAAVATVAPTAGAPAIGRPAQPAQAIPVSSAPTSSAAVPATTNLAPKHFHEFALTSKPGGQASGGQL